ncbi:MAG: HAD-IIB family hydrolase [bacterium]|nr:HAD-IIB family hydrolase [bacterium]
MQIKNPKIAIFDLDNTLSESRSRIDAEMAELICALLDKMSVAVISGASFSYFDKQLLSQLSCMEKFDRLFILPTSGAELWAHKENRWNMIYKDSMPDDLKKKATDAVASVAGIKAEDRKKYIDDRGTQITYAGLGADASMEEKKKYDPDQLKRRKFISEIKDLLPEFSLRIGGTSSIDITVKGVDKSFGIKRLFSFVGINSQDAVFIGDALYEGGNDESVKNIEGVRIIETSGPEHTKNIIRELVKI